MKPPERRWRTSTDWGPTATELLIIAGFAFLAGLLVGVIVGWWWQPWAIPMGPS